MYPSLLAPMLAIQALAFPPGDNPIPVASRQVGGYFVKNTTLLPHAGMGAWILKNQPDFDEVFQPVPPLGLQANGLRKQELQALPDKAFESHQVLALAIQAHTSATYDRVAVSRLDDTLRVSFKASVPEKDRLPKIDPPSSRAVFVSPLLLLVPSKAMEGVKKIEFNQEGSKPVIVPNQPSR